MEGANQFLRDHYIARFNEQFTVAAGEKGTAFRRTGRTDLNLVFTVQTERVVTKDNTVAIADRSWQIGKTRFRHTLAGSTVTIHEHLDGDVSIRFGPHVVGRYTAAGDPVGKEERRGNGGSMETGENQTQVSSASHTPLGIGPTTPDSHFSTAPATVRVLRTKKAARAA